MTWEELDWAALDRLREAFLSGKAAQGPYWLSPSDLASYDFTYGERIGWKWDQVLRELQLRGWRPASRDVFDWGCGSGVAARRVLGFFGASAFDSLTVWDHSPLAADFAANAATQAFAGLRVSSATPGLLADTAPIGLLLVSHVMTELSDEELAALRALALRSREILWVEPGTHEVSRRLGQQREALRPEFQVVAPCTHQLACPMFVPGAERDWCHFFAPPPPAIFADSDWVKFGQRAGIDLRSLPYSFLALQRTGGGPVPATEDGDEAATKLSRVIGRPEHFKPYARVLNCDAGGLAELEISKRTCSALFKELERTKAPLVYRWKRDGNKVVGGERLA